MPKTKGSISNPRRWDQYLDRTGQTSLGGVKHLITTHMTWRGLLNEIGLSVQGSNRDFFIARANEVGFYFDAVARKWTRVKKEAK